MKILLTAFDAFGDHKENPSEKIALRLKEEGNGAGQKIKVEILPTEFFRARQDIQQLIGEEKPDFVICSGLNEQAMVPYLEQIGLNWRQGRIADNIGFQPTGEMIDNLGEPVHLSTFDLNSLKSSLALSGYETKISNHAGCFVCNTVYYAALSFIRKNNLNVPCCFVHLPYPNNWNAESPSIYNSEELIGIMQNILMYCWKTSSQLS